MTEYKAKCPKCGFEIASENPSFCPNCGEPIPTAKSDAEISKLVFPTFGKKYSQALEGAYTSCIAGISAGTLHRNLFLTRRMDLLGKEIQYQDEAINRFIKKNKNDPKLKDALAHYKLALIYENAQKLIDATKEYKHALAAIPSFASAQLRRGMTWETRGGPLWDVHRGFVRGPCFTNALYDYQWAAYNDPQFPFAFFCAGLILKIKNRLNDAQAYYAGCVALDPDCAAAHNNLGLIYIDKKDFANAEREFNEVLRIYPNHPTGVKNFKFAQSKKGRGLRRII